MHHKCWLGHRAERAVGAGAAKMVRVPLALPFSFLYLEIKWKSPRKVKTSLWSSDRDATGRRKLPAGESRRQVTWPRSEPCIDLGRVYWHECLASQDWVFFFPVSKCPDGLHSDPWGGPCTLLGWEEIQGDRSLASRRRSFSAARVGGTGISLMLLGASFEEGHIQAKNRHTGKPELRASWCPFWCGFFFF